MEEVDILEPPHFRRSGKVKTRDAAIEDGDWIGTFNLWIVQTKPVPAIIYQQRSPKSSWAPCKLDVSAGGHYIKGEEGVQGLREAKEELGKDYTSKDIKYLGKRLYVGIDTKGRKNNAVVEVFMIEDNTPLEGYSLDKEEVHALCICPIKDLIKVHTEPNYSFTAVGISNEGKKIEIQVSKDSFPFNYDNYHYKAALLAKRFMDGEQNLLF